MVFWVASSRPEHKQSAVKGHMAALREVVKLVAGLMESFRGGGEGGGAQPQLRQHSRLLALVHTPCTPLVKALKSPHAALLLTVLLV